MVVSGRLIGDPVVGATVELWQELPGQRHFRRIAKTRVSAGGEYKFTFRRGTVRTDRKWYVTAEGVRSHTLHQRVKHERVKHRVKRHRGKR